MTIRPGEEPPLVQFERVDPDDERAYGSWFSVLSRSELFRNRGGEEGWRVEEWRTRARDTGAATYSQLFRLTTAGDAVVAGALEVTRDDNLEWIRGELFVDPAERRRGFGSLFLSHLEDTARALGRRSLLFWVVEAHHEVGHGPSRHFAPRHGYDNVEESVRRDIAWPRPVRASSSLHQHASADASSYRVVAWRAPTDEARLGERAQLFSVMPLEVPDAGFGYEAERWDPERVAGHERRADAMGRDLFVAQAYHEGSGEVVGFSELTVSRERPAVAYQWDTLVTRPHRGHGLGALMKLANMDQLDASRYPTKTIVTYNAANNAAMIAVNDALGARVNGGIVTWRKVLN